MLKLTRKFIILTLALAGTHWAQAETSATALSTVDGGQLETFQRFPGDPVRPERPGRPNRPVPNPPRFPDQPGYNQVTYYSLGQERTQKIISQTFSFYPQSWRDRVWSIRLVGAVNTTQVQSVFVVLADGREYRLDELEGSINARRIREAYLGGEYIREIRVVATSGNLTGSRGQFRVDIGVLRGRY